MIFEIALRNLWASKVRTLLVGGIVYFGALLLTFGNSFLDTIDQNMERSIVNAISGHFQLSQEGAKDKFELFSMDGGSEKDFGQINDFKKVRELVEALPNVKAVIPMGFNFAVVTTGNLLDRRLADLRDSVKTEDTHKTQVTLEVVRRLVDSLKQEEKTAEAITDAKRKAAAEEDTQNLDRAAKDDFWTQFVPSDGWKDKALDALEFLENKIARLMPGEGLVWMMYLGTDIERFRSNFDRFEKVDGELVPPGRRGILFNKRFYEEQLKNKTARRLDEIKERLDLGTKFEECEDCTQFIKLNIGQARSIAAQLDDDSEASVKKGLAAAVKDVPADPKGDETLALLKAFFDMNGQNFQERYKLFYDVIAPHILLYSVNIGDTFVLKSFGKGGYVRSVPVKVYGTFRFQGLDKSPITGAFNLVDMTSFRELYGLATPESLAELSEMKKDAGIKDVSAENAEDALFGDESDLVAEGEAKAFEGLKEDSLEQARKQYAETIADRAYTQEEIDSGLVINAAVLLKDDRTAEATGKAIEATLSSAGLGIKVTGWRDAAGIVGIMIMLFNVVLVAATFIFTIVSLIIVNNALMMSTLQRTGEIGTMRAVGASQGVIRRMIGLEAVLLALIFGGAGVGTAVALLAAFGGGFPVVSDFMQFLAGGTVFVPKLTLSALLIGVGFTLFSGLF
ncbi:MAG: hypothetical protein IV100_06765, partial [Myxococcales bacterium]|nr:hypothetical protein [Myxococcales bacterium]